MPNNSRVWTPAALAVLALIVVAGSIFALPKLLAKPQKQAAPAQQVKSTPTPSPIAKTVELSVEPKQISVVVGEKATIALVAISKTDKLSAAELKISFDPSAVKIEKVSAGEFFSNPTVLAQEIDNKTGKVDFALGSFTPKTGEGKIIVIDLQGVKAGKSKLNFEGTRVAVVGKKGNVANELGSIEVVVK